MMSVSKMSIWCSDLKEFLKSPEVHFGTQFYPETPGRRLCKTTKGGQAWACQSHLTLLGAKSSHTAVSGLILRHEELQGAD